ncbi:MAG: hypothetical protein AVDCRST_MAG52-2353, partial [uncultured Blastococcus sp.]
ASRTPRRRRGQPGPVHHRRRPALRLRQFRDPGVVPLQGLGAAATRCARHGGRG